MERGCYFLWAPPPDEPREPEPREELPRDALPLDFPDDEEPTRAFPDLLEEPLDRPVEGLAI